MYYISRMCVYVSFFVLVACGTSGCLAVAMAGYAEAKYDTYIYDEIPKITLGGLEPVETPKPLCLRCEYAGQFAESRKKPELDKQDRKDIVNILEETGLFDSIMNVEDKTDDCGQMDFYYDLDGADREGLSIFKLVYTAPGKDPVTKTYEHGYRSLEKSAPIPEGFKHAGGAFALGKAKSQVFRDVIYMFLHDLQTQEML